MINYIVKRPTSKPFKHHHDAIFTYVIIIVVHIWCFESSNKIRNRILIWLATYNKIFIVPYGIWSHTRHIGFPIVQVVEKNNNFKLP